MKTYNVNGQRVQAKSNKMAIVSLYPCLQFAVQNNLVSLTKAVSLVNSTFGLHIVRSQSAYVTSIQAQNNHAMSMGL